MKHVSCQSWPKLHHNVAMAPVSSELLLCPQFDLQRHEPGDGDNGNPFLGFRDRHCPFMDLNLMKLDDSQHL